MTDTTDLEKMAQLLAQNPDLLKKANEYAAPKTPAKAAEETGNSWMKLINDAMKTAFEQQAPGLGGNQEEASEQPKSEPEKDEPMTEQEDSTSPDPKAEGEDEPMAEEEREDEPVKEEEEEEEPPVKEEPDTTDPEDFDIYPKEKLKELLQQVEELKKLKTQLKEQHESSVKSREQKEKELKEANERIAQMAKAIEMVHKGVGVEEVIRNAAEYQERKIRAKQKDMEKAYKAAKKITDAFTQKEGNEDYNPEFIRATKKNLELLHQASQEKDATKAADLVGKAEGLQAFVSAAAAQMAQANHRMSDLEKQLQASKKKRAASSGKRKRTDFPSPSDLSKGKGKERTDRKNQSEESEEEKALRIELTSFASSTFKVWADDPEPKYKRNKRPFCRADFEKMIPFGESIKPEFALLVGDQFGYRKRGAPHYRDVMARAFRGEVNAVQSIDESQEEACLIPPPDPSIQGGGYTRDQMKSWGFIKED